MSRTLFAIQDDTAKELNQLAHKKNITSLDVIKRALALYMLLDTELIGFPKRELAIVEDNRIITKIIID